MNINEVLWAKLTRHTKICRPDPVAIYLGNREHRALEMEMARHLTAPQQIASYPPRSKWNGLSVYRVDDEHHIAFA